MKELLALAGIIILANKSELQSTIASSINYRKYLHTVFSILHNYNKEYSMQNTGFFHSITPK